MSSQHSENKGNTDPTINASETADDVLFAFASSVPKSRIRRIRKGREIGNGVHGDELGGDPIDSAVSRCRAKSCELLSA